MKKNFLPLMLIIILGIIVFKLDTITDYTASIVDATPDVTIDKKNTYTHEDDFLYVQNSLDFVPYSRQDILNILFSIFNNGYETFTFYCPNEYTECLNDVEEITSDQIIITDLGNYVHPFNNFTNLKVVTDSLGEVDIIVKKMYTDEMIDEINYKLDKIWNEVVTDDMDIHDKILAIHDYIIDTTYYDTEDSLHSGNAYGALIEGKAKCAGYADAMAIVLGRLGVKNYKVASQKHVWNAAFLDDEWSQIDLTWDDPVVTDGTTLSETIRHKFYMVDTETLLSYDTLEHNFDPKVYIELK